MASAGYNKHSLPVTEKVLVVYRKLSEVEPYARAVEAAAGQSVADYADQLADPQC